MEHAITVHNNSINHKIKDQFKYNHIRSKLQNFITRISAQQTVAPDAVTRVFPCIGGYKEFAPTIT
jgi:hypothetical protein